MKKLLKVLVLALALCMLCNVALAAARDDVDDDKNDDIVCSTPDGIPWNDAMRVHKNFIDIASYTVVTKPTCTETGLARYDCYVEENHFHELVLPALGHVWSSTVDGKHWGRVTKEPTCMEEGKAVDYCTVCGVLNDFVLPRIIDKIPHVWKQVIEKKPTCVANGVAHDECKYGCGTIRVDMPRTDKNGRYPVTIEEYLKLDPKYEKHDWDEWVVEVKATCCEEGRSVRWCKACADKQKRVDAKLKPIYKQVNPSRLVDCYNEVWQEICILCNSKCPDHPVKDYHRDVISHTFKHEPEYEVEHVEPTCETDGYILYRCVWHDDTNPLFVKHVVGDKYEYDKVVLPATGHDWNKWTLRYKPNEQGNEYGYWVRDCKICHKTEERISTFAPAGLSDRDGAWKLYDEKGNVRTDYIGLYEFQGSKFMVNKGVVDTSVNGAGSPVPGIWYFFSQGRICHEFSGLAEYNGEWFVVESGILNIRYNGLYNYNGGKIWVAAGQKTHANGLVQTEEGWLYFEDGCVIPHNGLVNYDGAIFYVQGGKLQESFTGKVKDHNGTEFNVVNGMVK